MADYYDRDGEQIDQTVWLKLLGEDNRVAVDTFGDALISTVWLGLNHRLNGYGPPLIYETMIFVDGQEVFQTRYSSEGDARTGHDLLVGFFNAHGPEALTALLSEQDRLFPNWDKEQR